MNHEETSPADPQSQVLWLSRALRALVVAFAVAANLRLFNVLRQGDRFGEVFDEMLAGAKIPTSTEIFTSYPLEIYGATSLLTVAAVFVILAKKREPMFLAFGVLVGFLSYVLSEAASYAYWLPIQEVMRQLTG